SDSGAGSASSTRARAGAATLSTSSISILRSSFMIWRQSSEYPLCPFDLAHQRGDVVRIAVEPEARPRRGRYAQVLHQRLRAMVPGADRDVLFVQYGAQIVGVNPVERETDDPGGVIGPEHAHVVHPA